MPDQTKLLRELLLIRHTHLYMNGRLKLRFRLPFHCVGLTCSDLNEYRQLSARRTNHLDNSYLKLYSSFLEIMMFAKDVSLFSSSYEEI